MPPSPPKRVLITGASGFVGSHLTKHVVERGWEVLALVRPGSSLQRLEPVLDRISLIQADMEDTAALSSALAGRYPELCVDSAWTSPRGEAGPVAHLGSVANTLRLASLMLEHGCRRFVHTGTCFEYDVTRGVLSERSPTEPHTLYGTCKRSLHAALAKLAEEAPGFELVWPRIFYVYGPWEQEGRLVPSVVRGLLEGRTTPTSGGEQVRDYMHVEDVAAAVWAAADSDHVGPVNVASGRSTTVRAIVESIGNLVGRPELLDIGALPYRPEEPPSVRADVTLLCERLGWQPRYTLESGLEHTVRWWQQRMRASR